MDKEKYATHWYDNRPFAVIEIPYAEDVDFVTELMTKNNIHYDYRSLSENGNNVIVVFKDKE